MDRSFPRTVADVALASPGSGPPVLSYTVPPELRGVIRVGDAVRITVKGRACSGYVVELRALHEVSPLAGKLVPLVGLCEDTPSLSEDELALAKWLAEEYLAPLGDAIRTIRVGTSPANEIMQLRLTEQGREVAALEDSQVARSKIRAGIIRALEENGGELSYQRLRALFGDGTSAAVRWLRGRGYVQMLTGRSRATKPRQVLAVRLAGTYELRGSWTEAQRRVLERLSAVSDPIPVSLLMSQAGVTRSVIETLVRKGALERMHLPVRRSPLPDRLPVCSVAPAYTDEQEAAIEAILEDLRSPAEAKRPILIHGVTASGKTEIYLEAIRYVRQRGLGAVVLVPEIALASQVVELIAQRFGTEVALLHSALSSGERYDEWQRVLEGEATVAVGARSAVFAPMHRLGLIVVDEEHEAAYKQENTPQYHARDVAIERARRSGATVVLGSATPSLETYHEACSGRYRLVTLGKRATGAALPQVAVVDMRREYKRGPVLFSELLLQELRARLAKGEQALLFLNRRGYSAFVLCRDCGHVATCPNCAVSLTYHSSAKQLRCHHCGHAEGVPEACPICGGIRLRGFGLGTERIEQEVRATLPEARVLRMDRDTTARKGAHSQIIRAFRNGEADVLVGTQMIAKGLDFPNVTLVGVVSADTGLHIPDFRASERTFQLLAQVAGRAGRAQAPGLVIVQTFTPEHYAIQCAAEQDYGRFYEAEIVQRRELNYPPFVRIANVVASSEDGDAAQTAVQALAEFLRTVPSPSVEVTGPAPAPIPILKREHRWHLIVRSGDRSALVGALRDALHRLPHSARSLLTVDMDPITLA